MNCLRGILVILVWVWTKTIKACQPQGPKSPKRSEIRPMMKVGNFLDSIHIFFPNHRDQICTLVNLKGFFHLCFLGTKKYDFFTKEEKCKAFQTIDK